MYSYIILLDQHRIELVRILIFDLTSSAPKPNLAPELQYIDRS